ncbi:MAG: hypothetical protein LKI34_01015 [Bifidobacterium tibiigranuli]|uniref:hypothetical protein n=1 Tax=Bifidobacterium tibiigranuli TaxID=2172043 RepID=UPI0026ED9385|nr:hypothetical protein [Bifidobacterium tibiigranuli]MCI1672791.1 hypothetical protein [Bifidobacterium tibiigranuli]MCI1713630.1 hypothetical protein [Bifidobacterium tibiigranuli]
MISNGFVTGPFDKSAAVTSPNWLISIQHNEPALSPPCPKEQPWLLAEVGVASSAEAEAAVAIPVSPNVIAPAATTALNFFKKFGLLAEGERYGCASNEFLKCIVPFFLYRQARFPSIGTIWHRLQIIRKEIWFPLEVRRIPSGK